MMTLGVINKSKAVLKKTKNLELLTSLKSSSIDMQIFAVIVAKCVNTKKE
jgi:hypothetical protein